MDVDARTLVLDRGSLRVAVNLSTQPVSVALDGQPTQVLLASGEATTTPDNVRLGGESFAVVAL
jgi:maltooligosyltrehalose trehalohydrolase